MLQIRDIVQECEYLRARLLMLFREKYHVQDELINDFYDEWNRTWSSLLYREEDLRREFKVKK